MTGDDYIRAYCLSSLERFARHFFKAMYKKKFIVSWHHAKIIAALQEVAEGKCRKLIINMPPRYGKAIDIDTPMLTPKGWSRAGDVKVGDMLFGSDGKPTKVIGRYPQGKTDAYKVTFSDGSSLITCSEHLWSVFDRNWRIKNNYKIRKTKELIGNLYMNDGHKRYNIPMTKPIKGKDEGLLIDPYLFGLWLGDGSSYKAEITTMDEEIKNAFGDTYGVTLRKQQSAGKALTYGIVGGFVTKLKELGVFRNKRIPIQYLLASEESRFALLQGLLDTDGTCNRKNGQISLCLTKKDLRDDTIALIDTLGLYRTVYKSSIYIRIDRNPFRIERKGVLFRHLNSRHSSKRFISDISKVEDRETICFEVDAIDHLYLAGRELVVTHNTELAVKSFIGYGLAVNPSSKFVHLSYSDDLARDNSETVRSLILHDEFRRIFPYIELSQSSRSKKKWTTTDGGGVYATSTGGQITGFGAGATDELDDEIGQITTQRFAGAIIIDDPIKPEDALSDARREKVNDRFETTIRNRVNSRNTPIVIIMQRTHKHDLTGYLLEKEPGEWRVLSLPAIITDEAGEHALWEFKHTLPELYKLREINRFVFETQYMQNPMPMEGLLYVDDRWKEYDTLPVTNTAIRRNCTDTADKGSDWLCSICYVETELGNFITDVTFTQSPMEETESEVARMLHANLTQQADIEGNNGGRGFARNVESKLRILGNTTCRVSDFAQTANKETRILTGSAAVQNMTYFPRGWRQRWSQFYGQLSGYMRSGRNAHDDAADCLTMTVERRGESRYQSFEGEVHGDTITQVHLNLNGRAWYCVAVIKDGVTYITDGGVYEGQKLSGEIHVEADASTMAKAYTLREEADAYLRKDTPNKQGFMDQWSAAVTEFRFRAGLGELYSNLITYDRTSTYEAMYLLCRVAERVARMKINS